VGAGVAGGYVGGSWSTDGGDEWEAPAATSAKPRRS